MILFHEFYREKQNFSMKVFFIMSFIYIVKEDALTRHSDVEVYMKSRNTVFLVQIIQRVYEKRVCVVRAQHESDVSAHPLFFYHEFYREILFYRD